MRRLLFFFLLLPACMGSSAGGDGDADTDADTDADADADADTDADTDGDGDASIAWDVPTEATVSLGEDLIDLTVDPDGTAWVLVQNDPSLEGLSWSAYSVNASGGTGTSVVYAVDADLVPAAIAVTSDERIAFVGTDAGLHAFVLAMVSQDGHQNVVTEAMGPETLAVDAVADDDGHVYVVGDGGDYATAEIGDADLVDCMVKRFSIDRIEAEEWIWVHDVDGMPNHCTSIALGDDGVWVLGQLGVDPAPGAQRGAAHLTFAGEADSFQSVLDLPAEAGAGWIWGAPLPFAIEPDGAVGTVGHFVHSDRTPGMLGAFRWRIGAAGGHASPEDLGAAGDAFPLSAGGSWLFAAYDPTSLLGAPAASAPQSPTFSLRTMDPSFGAGRGASLLSGVASPIRGAEAPDGSARLAWADATGHIHVANVRSEP